MRNLRGTIKDIIKSRQARKDFLFVIGLYLLSILAGLFLAGLFYVTEFG
jgi:hypothetical protein